MIITSVHRIPLLSDSLSIVIIFGSRGRSLCQDGNHSAGFPSSQHGGGVWSLLLILTMIFLQNFVITSSRIRLHQSFVGSTQMDKVHIIL